MERTYMVTEICPHCENEINMFWNTDEMGFKAFCPVCGERLMLCDECMHRTGELINDCDYCSKSDSCRFNRKDNQVEMNVVLDKGAYLPNRAHEEDAGLDLFAPYDFDVPKSYGNDDAGVVRIGFAVVDTGVHVELPKDTVGMIKSKSGLNINRGLITEGVIDEGYTGSICVKIYNLTENGFRFSKGDKIAQLVILPIVKPRLNIVTELKKTDRGNGGFGSTGK